MENIETAILLMVVGMATVFVILLIVIYLGKLLITLVNKYAPEEVAGKTTREIDRRDGVKVIFDDDSWLMMRPSGTEPLVRIYAEAPTKEDVNALLAAATEVVAD